MSVNRTTASAWRAMAGSPVRFLGSTLPLRSLAYLVTGALLGPLVFASLVGLWSAGAVLSVFVVGLFVLAGSVFVGIPVGALERRRLRILRGRRFAPAESPHQPVARPGLRPWARARFRERATWREFGYAVGFAVFGSVLNLAAVALVLFGVTLVLSPLLVALLPAGSVVFDGHPFDPVGTVPVALLGLLVLVAAGYLVTMLAEVAAVFARFALTPREAESESEQAGRVVELTRSRRRLVDAFEVERRRIERDLHDGAQQRMVVVAMTLGLAELELADVPGEARRLVARAHREATQALAELRELVRGIHPRVLTDLGLAAAVTELADRCPYSVSVRIAVDGRLPTEVEAAAYFVVSEALTNVLKHSGASNAEVTARLANDTLVVTVGDDGVGGAGLASGTGLRGLADRVAVLDGRLVLRSPPGGPTVLSAEIPCPMPRSG